MELAQLQLARFREIAGVSSNAERHAVRCLCLEDGSILLLQDSLSESRDHTIRWKHGLGSSIIWFDVVLQQKCCECLPTMGIHGVVYYATAMQDSHT